MDKVRDGGPCDSSIIRYHIRYLRSDNGVVPGGHVKARHTVEDVCRVELPDTRVKSPRDLLGGELENLFGCGTEHADACHFGKEVGVHGALIDCNLNLRCNNTKAQQ